MLRKGREEEGDVVSETGPNRATQPLTPSARVRVVDCGIDVAEVDLAHEAVDLESPISRGKRGEKRATYVELSREAREAGLTVYAGKNVKRQLFWLLDDDVVARCVPSDHMVVLGAFQEAVGSG